MGTRVPHLRKVLQRGMVARATTSHSLRSQGQHLRRGGADLCDVTETEQARIGRQSGTSSRPADWRDTKRILVKLVPTLPNPGPLGNMTTQSKLENLWFCSWKSSKICQAATVVTAICDRVLIPGNFTYSIHNM